MVENPNSTTGQYLNSWDVSRSCTLFYDSNGWGSKYVRLKNINKPIQFKIMENENSRNREYMLHKHIQFLTLQNINTPELPPKWGINCHYGVRDLINNNVIDQADRLSLIHI